MDHPRRGQEALGGILGYSVVWDDGQTTPKLGLDLEGGTNYTVVAHLDEEHDAMREALQAATS